MAVQTTTADVDAATESAPIAKNAFAAGIDAAAEPDESHWRLTTEGERFVDAKGRTVHLHGVNVPCKLPTGPSPMPTHLEAGPGKDGGHWDFFDGRSVSFVGRPFPLEEADEHLLRLRSWGFNCLRFNVAWEAIEHAGPGQYDHDYITYVRKVLERAAAHGLWVYIDPHQDAWSRFTGGSGHPSWTLELAGMDVRKLVPCGAAVLHQTWPGDKATFTRMVRPPPSRHPPSLELLTLTLTLTRTLTPTLTRTLSLTLNPKPYPLNPDPNP